MTSAELNVVTLNAWGVPVGSSNVQERMQAIADTLAAGEYDVVLLEEIWMKTSFDTIKKRVEATYPHSHFFRAHIIGSGMCIFSRYPIVHTLYFRFSTNGYYDRALIHGDSLCGKGVGLAVIRVGDFTANVYVTHLHADYAPGETAITCSYDVQRAAQAFELARFISLTSNGACDLIVLGGDLNCRPDSLGYRLLRSLTSLHDSYDFRDDAKDADSKVATNWSTCTRPDNSYTVVGSKPGYEGQRIDYLMHVAPHAGVKVESSRFGLAFGKMPHAPHLNYSDHEGVRCTLKLSRVDNHQSEQHSSEAEHQRKTTARELLAEVHALVVRGMDDVARRRFFFLAMAVACVALLCVAPFLSCISSILVVLFTALVSVVLACTVLLILGDTRSEHHALENLEQDVRVLQRTYDSNK